jgi:hypothetical protein
MFLARFFNPTQLDVTINITIDRLVKAENIQDFIGQINDLKKHCHSYLFAFREELQKRINVFDALAETIKKNVLALGFIDKDNKLKDPDFLLQFYRRYPYFESKCVEGVSKENCNKILAEIKPLTEVGEEYGKLLMTMDELEKMIVAKTVDEAALNDLRTHQTEDTKKYGKRS